MNDFDFEFESAPWEALLEAREQGGALSAAHFLAALEGEDDDGVESAFEALRQRQITLDFSDFPNMGGSGEAAVRLRQEQQLVQQGKLLTGLAETDPLRLYLEELAAMPVCGDITLLAADYLDGKEENAEKLVNLSLSRVIELAEAYVGRGVLLLDLIQEGSLGLWQGILGYTGGDFEAHRDWWIHHYLAKAVIIQALASGVGQKMRQAVEDYRQVDERLLSDLGRNPTLEEIALEMHITPDEAASVKKMMDNARDMNKVKAEREEKNEPDPEEEQAVEDTAYFQMRQRVSELLADLDPQDAKLLTLRYGLEGGLPMTPEEAGKHLGLTPEEVLTKEAAALAKLRKN